MAELYKPKDSKGRIVGWPTVVCFDGRPVICKQHARTEEAQDWANEIERQIKQCQFNFELYKNKHTFNELVERYRNDGALEHTRSIEDVIRHVEYWTSRISKLKENPGRDRVFTQDEITRLLSACKQSKSSYLHCIVVISLTTGTRQGQAV